MVGPVLVHESEDSSSKFSNARLIKDWMFEGGCSPSTASTSSEVLPSSIAHLIVSASPWRSFNTYFLNKIKYYKCKVATYLVQNNLNLSGWQCSLTMSIWGLIPGARLIHSDAAETILSNWSWSQVSIKLGSSNSFVFPPFRTCFAWNCYKQFERLNLKMQQEEKKDIQLTICKDNLPTWLSFPDLSRCHYQLAFYQTKAQGEQHQMHTHQSFQLSFHA